MRMRIRMIATVVVAPVELQRWLCQAGAIVFVVVVQWAGASAVLRVRVRVYVELCDWRTSQSGSAPSNERTELTLMRR